MASQTTSAPGDLLKKVAGGLTLHGVFYTKFHGIKTLSKQTIQCPENLELVGSTLDLKEESLSLENKSQYEVFNSLTSSFGITTAAEITTKGANFLNKFLPTSAKGSFKGEYDKTSEVKTEEEGKHQFLAYIKYTIYPKAAIKIKPEDLRLEDSVVKDLQGLEKTVQSCFEISTFERKCEEVMQNHGSHVSIGIINFGGACQTRATHETHSATSARYMQDHLRTAVELELLGTLSLSQLKVKASASGKVSTEENTESTEKRSDENAVIHVSKIYSGGRRAMEDIDAWRESLDSPEQWAIIERSTDIKRDFKGIWYVLQSHAEHFTHTKGLGLLLQYVWHRMNGNITYFEINDESAANDLAELIIGEIVTQLRNALQENNSTQVQRFLTQLQKRFDWLGECVNTYTHAFDCISAAITQLQSMIQLQSSTADTYRSELEALCSTMQDSLTNDKQPRHRHGHLSNLCIKKWARTKSIHFEELAICLLAIGEFVYVSMGKAGIQIYDMELNLVSTVCQSGMEFIGRIEEVDGKIAFLEQKGLFVMEPSGAGLTQIAHGIYHDIAACSGTVYALKYPSETETVIDVFQQKRTGWEKRHSIDVSGEQRYSINLFAINNVAYAGFRAKETAYLISPDGELLLAESENFFAKTKVCQADRHGCFLTAQNFFLQVYDTNQGSYSASIVDKQPYIRDAVYTQDRLFILHNYEPTLMDKVAIGASFLIPFSKVLVPHSETAMRLNATLSLFQA